MKQYRNHSTKLCRLPLVAVTVAAALCCVLGCSKKSDDALYPPPGTMTVVSIEPVEVDAEAASAVTNPLFANWWAGAPAPEGYGTPDPALSSIERVARTKEGAFIARQTWKSTDVDKAPEQAFRFDLGQLEANKTYYFVVEAALTAGRSVTLQLWDTAGKKSVDKPFMQLVPSTGVVKRYTKSFTPTVTGSYLISAASDGAASVDWYRWDVVPEWAAS